MNGRGGVLIDRATQRWVAATGRRIDLTTQRWLDGPVGREVDIGGTWLGDEVRRVAGIAVTEHDQGLLPVMSVLDRDDFRTGDLHPDIVDFYEHTRRWRMDVWSQWSPVFLPGAWGLMALFARRLQQFSLPLRPLDLSRGMTSRVTQVATPSGEVIGAAWERTVVRTGEQVYAGWYGVTALPGRRWRSVRVVFPLPNGSLQVFLRPDLAPGGALRLTSGPGRFGDDGAYLVVARGRGDSPVARRIPIAETFEVYVDDDGVLRADHHLRMWRASVLRLHYRLTRAPVGVG